MEKIITMNLTFKSSKTSEKLTNVVKILTKDFVNKTLENSQKRI